MRDPSFPFDFHGLRMFLSVCEAGGMTAAANRLAMTQSAVSQAIQRLEADLGAELFDRRARPLQRTPAGDELKAQAERILADGERLRAAVRSVAESTVPAVRIGFVDSFAATVGPELVRRLRNHADRLSVWSGISPNLVQDLMSRRLDLVVSSDPLTRDPDITHRELVLEPFVMALPRTMARAVGDIRLEDLARNHPFVSYSLRSMIGEQIERYLDERYIEVPRSLEFDGSDPVFAMVAGGVGWAITTPLCLIHGRSLTKTLHIAPLPGPAFTRRLYLLYRRDEWGAMADAVAAETRTILARMVENEITDMAPWAAEEIRLGGEIPT